MVMTSPWLGNFDLINSKGHTAHLVFEVLSYDVVQAIQKSIIFELWL